MRIIKLNEILSDAKTRPVWINIKRIQFFHATKGEDEKSGSVISFDGDTVIRVAEGPTHIDGTLALANEFDRPPSDEEIKEFEKHGVGEFDRQLKATIARACVLVGRLGRK